MAKATILIVEDDDIIQDQLRTPLREAHFAIQSASSAEAAFRYFKAAQADLVLLNPALPGMDGLEFCQRLKTEPHTRHIPVIVMSTRDEEIDIVTALEVGARDYIVIPFSVRITMSRIRATLRERQELNDSEEKIIQIGDLTIDPFRYEVRLNKKKLPLTLTEFRTLQMLASNPGRVYTRQQIVDEVRGDEYAVTERAVDIQVFNLRSKLGNKKDMIETLRGVGYRFRDA